MLKGRLLNKLHTISSVQDIGEVQQTRGWNESLLGFALVDP